MSAARAVGLPKTPLSLSFARFDDAVLMLICSSRYPSLDDAFGNKGGSRFDDPQRVYKTLYCAPDFETCYSETLLRDQTYQSDGVYVVGRKDHFDRMLQLLVVDVSKLRLVDLMGPGRRSMGYSFSTGLGPYSQTKPLARASTSTRIDPTASYTCRISPTRPSPRSFCSTALGRTCASLMATCRFHSLHYRSRSMPSPCVEISF
ncbi:RES family NAD+ phosphorylase [Variovorax sp. RHLX14]|uniref:RES family NAD+ phosphorylase n=1 Tax=Variovorax sp. RHLX14 TaxID=1259731 RepID=UPI003F46F00C